MWVLTVDQEGSRRQGDRVDALLDQLAAAGPLAGSAPSGLARPFERTAGDEVQAVMSDPRLAVDVALHLLDLGGWSVGVGAGPVDEPLPASARAGSGQAFVLAREAVEAAKARRPRTAPPVVVRGASPELAAEADAVLVLLGTVAARRSPAGREVVQRLRERGGVARQEDLAAALGVSQQAVSERLRIALWAEEVAARPAAARLLGLAALAPDTEGEA
jgi:hypothetical protein